MFRCRLFPGQYLLLTRKQGEDRSDQVEASLGILVYRIRRW
jgi:hypothetical protein